MDGRPFVLSLLCRGRAGYVIPYRDHAATTLAKVTGTSWIFRAILRSARALRRASLLSEEGRGKLLKGFGRG